MPAVLVHSKEIATERRTSRVVHRQRRDATPDQVFAELDGQPIAVGGVRGTIEVYSVHDSDGARWVQLAIVGDRFQMVTVRLPAGESAARAFLSLSSWLVDPDHATPEILNVA